MRSPNYKLIQDLYKKIKSKPNPLPIGVEQPAIITMAYFNEFYGIYCLRYSIYVDGKFNNPPIYRRVKFYEHIDFQMELLNRIADLCKVDEFEDLLNKKVCITPTQNKTFINLDVTGTWYFSEEENQKEEAEDMG